MFGLVAGGAGAFDHLLAWTFGQCARPAGRLRQGGEWNDGGYCRIRKETANGLDMRPSTPAV